MFGASSGNWTMIPNLFLGNKLMGSKKYDRWFGWDIKDPFRDSERSRSCYGCIFSGVWSLYQGPEHLSEVWFDDFFIHVCPSNITWLTTRTGFIFCSQVRVNTKWLHGHMSSTETQGPNSEGVWFNTLLSSPWHSYYLWLLSLIREYQGYNWTWLEG